MFPFKKFWSLISIWFRQSSSPPGKVLVLSMANSSLSAPIVLNKQACTNASIISHTSRSAHADTMFFSAVSDYPQTCEFLSARITAQIMEPHFTAGGVDS